MKLFLPRKFTFTIVFFLLLTVQFTNGQAIKYLGIENGLSNNSVTSIFQDHYGFMWFGTYGGLNRYDGYNFKIFKNKWGDNRSLINNHIICINEGIDHKIWVGTEKGLVYYNYADAKIHLVYYRDQNQSKIKQVTCRINSIAASATGEIYIASDADGLLICNRGDTICKQVLRVDNTTAYNIQKVMVDRQKCIWVFVSGAGLCTYNSKDNKLTLVNSQLKGISCLAADNYSHFIWMGAENGLYRYNIDSNRLVNLNTPDLKLSNKNIMHLHPDRQGRIWIATDGGGVNILSPKSGKVSYLLPGEQKGSLSSGAVYDVFEDRDAIMWIATLRGGVNIIDYKNQQFKSITHDPQNKNSLVNDFTRSFCEDEHNNIWIGTAGGGLSFWNTTLNTYTNYIHNDADTTSLNSNFVMSITNDYKNNIWVATFNGGINLFDKQTHSFKHYKLFNTFSKYEERNAWRLFEDSHHNLWASVTRGGALYLYNRTKDEFEMFDHRLMSINCFCEDKAGVLWAGTNNELIRVDTKNKNHEITTINSEVHALHEDKMGNFWIGTDGGGLLLFNRQHKKFTRYTQDDGLSDNSVINILEDDQGFLWLSTYNGISKFNPRSKTFKNYYASDGLQSNQFNHNAALKLHSGQFLFGGIKGFNRFDPDSIKANVSSPKVFLTNFKINNSPVEELKDFEGKAAINLQNITIPYDKAVISVDFVAIEYSFPDKISYSYYLEGWDHVWNNSGKIKVANYSRLNEGSYILRIKATNSDGAWSNNERVVHITILPPWYRSWWAYVLYVSALASVTYWFWLYRIRQTRLKYEVTIANLKVEKEKEANEKKLSFFTNVSHEFRTPLTLIINPIKDLLRQNKENHSELDIIYRNARRLLGLVDHLLLFRKTESENTDLKIVKTNFNELCHEVYICFTHQAKIKNITYTFQSCGNKIELYLDREKIEIALFNLISNAIKFTPDGGHIDISIREDEASVYFEIADSGVGITTDVGEKLFDKFYQVKDANSLKTGFGIGLYLVKTFIENHKGTINYKSTLGGGTTFTLTLPKGKAHLLNYQITEFSNDAHSFAFEELIDYDNSEKIIAEPVLDDLAIFISDKQSILIIDDNQEIRSYIKKIFSNDYLIFEAGDGDLGLELIKKHLPDVVISDIVMPGLSGLEICKIIKQDSALSHIPIILLTGEQQPDMRLQGIEDGAVDFINKPFDKDLLVARIKGIIKNKAELQNYFFSEITLKGKSRNISEEHKDFLYRCIEIIEKSLTDPNFEVNDIADKMGMSYSTLFKRIKLVTGLSLNGFVRFVRLRKAAELMINTNCNVSQAAFRVGISDIKYFREQFNKQFGLNPSDFIKRHRSAFQKSYMLQTNHK